MNYGLIKDVLDLVQEFEIETNNNNHFETSVEGFKKLDFDKQ
jgi:hypothetical protein